MSQESVVQLWDSDGQWWIAPMEGDPMTERDWIREQLSMSQEHEAELLKERDAWKEIAERHARNEAFLADLLDQSAAYLGPEVFVSDDGSVQDTPLKLKVPELVKALKEERDALRAEITRLTEVADTLSVRTRRAERANLDAMEES